MKLGMCVVYMEWRQLSFPYRIRFVHLYLSTKWHQCCGSLTYMVILEVRAPAEKNVSEYFQFYFLPNVISDSAFGARFVIVHPVLLL